MEYFAVFIPSLENAGECLLKVIKIKFENNQISKLKVENRKITEISTQFNFFKRSRVLRV